MYKKKSSKNLYENNKREDIFRQLSLWMVIFVLNLTFFACNLYYFYLCESGSVFGIVIRILVHKVAGYWFNLDPDPHPQHWKEVSVFYRDIFFFIDYIRSGSENPFLKKLGKKIPIWQNPDSRQCFKIIFNFCLWLGLLAIKLGKKIPIWQNPDSRQCFKIIIFNFSCAWFCLVTTTLWSAV